MPQCDAASLAAPAVVSHEGRLWWWLDHTDREIRQVQALTLQNQLLSSTCLQKSHLHCPFPEGSAGLSSHSLPVSGGLFCWQCLLRKPMWFIGCIWFCRLPWSWVGKGHSNFSHCSPQASNSSCLSGKECLFYRIPLLFIGKTGTILSFQVCISSIESGN